MSDLAAFIRARLGEDEATAKAAGGDAWEHEAGLYHAGASHPFAGVWTDSGLENFGAEGDHAARHDPARVLREVAAKRAILDMWRSFAENFTHVDETVFEHAKREALEDALEHLAAVWSDHPDYRAGWKP